MTQNRTHAVMAQRHEAHDSLDDFPTPPWAARALCEMLNARGFDLRTLNCLEPAANRGYLVHGLNDYFGHVVGADIHDYGAGFPVLDFLFGPSNVYDVTISNPPFRLAQEFVWMALRKSHHLVAMLCRTQFSESATRYEGMFQKRRPHFIFQFVERVPMVKGRCDPKASTATAYAWYVWKSSENAASTTYDWIPPCRKLLERPGDYDKRGK